MQTTEIKDFIIKNLEAKKAEDISCIDLQGKVPLADHMIFASGRSSKNIKAIAEFVALELKHTLKWNAYVEGMQGSDWIVLDAGSVVVHLFHPEARENFKLEELWQDK